LQQLEHVRQQLAVAHATQHKLEQQLQEQAEQHQTVLSDQQTVHESTSKKLFRELKAAQAAKEQALAGKRVAEQTTRCATLRVSPAARAARNFCGWLLHHVYVQRTACPMLQVLLTANGAAPATRPMHTSEAWL
jgi:hypothetical protein